MQTALGIGVGMNGTAQYYKDIVTSNANHAKSTNNHNDVCNDSTNANNNNTSNSNAQACSPGTELYFPFLPMPFLGARVFLIYSKTVSLLSEKSCKLVFLI